MTADFLIAIVLISPLLFFALGASIAANCFLLRESRTQHQRASTSERLSAVALDRFEKERNRREIVEADLAHVYGVMKERKRLNG